MKLLNMQIFTKMVGLEVKTKILIQIAYFTEAWFILINVMEFGMYE